MFYPAYINLQDRKCLVVGGGTVAERKVVTMLLSGGDVTVISPDATELLTFLSHLGTIRWHKRQLKAGDTNGYFLVCAATDFTDINSAVFAEAHEKNKIRLVNVVDVIPQCTFAAASVVTDGELMLSISTSGKSPATSRRIREYFETLLNADSLYTLGYEAEKPVPIKNQGLPYPVYLLLENRKCVVLCEQKTEEIERRVSLLRQSGASVLCPAPDTVDRHYLEDAFLVIADETSTVNTPCENGDRFIWEYLDEPGAGTHFTPHLVTDDNLIISVAARSSAGTEKAEQLRKKLANQFENNGYGAFIEFLGARRSEILQSFPTPKKRADFFELLIDSVEDTVSGLQTPPTKCCLGLTNPECSAECLFNWVRNGRLEHANALVSKLLDKAHQCC
ncbi:bifunctional precorrin-2 dehydrogenase/sirohydrochlorin ferrochelatase [Candidatus Poribacteria bacterium]|nr:bifunctional precorrin-2 dehydrogenase/sirohydrochlorin ferrochelatase [Candidatus Poribacteria bacterium]MYK17685.1 bifunctional precorrin-2 dehydrogenase/sirohydrochlorin ferrochelatase [Candidatus Poribacteria bacterium]